ncbi:hypothetical protein F4604DRAFT_1677299 [Suillus subluteus]|nr:hypothetical protein F4604DRAFT_1677299 [Suillus subluteus]
MSFSITQGSICQWCCISTQTLKKRLPHILNGLLCHRQNNLLDPPITIDADSTNEDEIQLEGPRTNKRLIKGRKPVAQSAQSSDVEDADLAQSAAPDEDEDEDKDEDEDSLPSMKPPKKWQKKAQPLPNADSVDAEGFLTDIEVMDVDEPLKPQREQCSRDIDTLFSAPYLKDSKKFRDCHACR